MNNFIKFLLVVLVVMMIVGVIYKIAHQETSFSTDPDNLPTYEEVVPNGFSALGSERVLDFGDAGVLLEPRIGVVKIADDIVRLSCNSLNKYCTAKALYIWSQTHIDYIQVLPSREHIISPEETILYRQGDDTTLSILVAAFYRSQGINARVGKTPYITFIEAQIQNETVRVDPGCANCKFGTTRSLGEENRFIWIH